MNLKDRQEGCHDLTMESYQAELCFFFSITLVSCDFCSKNFSGQCQWGKEILNPKYGNSTTNSAPVKVKNV